MNILAFHPTTNTGDKHDATGAFIPEAEHFMRFHGQPNVNRIPIDNTLSPDQMKRAVLDALARHRGTNVDGVVFFCHGFRFGIQLGFRNSDANVLAQALAGVFGANAGIVTFFACDTARDNDQDRNDDLAEFGGDGGFADLVRDDLCIAGHTMCHVDAHTTAAHATMNPNVRRFEGKGSPVGGVGGYYIVPRDKPMWGKWQNALRTEFRFEFPYLTTAEIYQRLAVM